MLSDMHWTGQVALLYKHVFLCMYLCAGHSCSPWGSRETPLGHGARCLCVQWCMSQWKHTWIHCQAQRHGHTSSQNGYLFTNNNSSIEECRQINLEVSCNFILNYLTLTLSIALDVCVQFMCVCVHAGPQMDMWFHLTYQQTWSYLQAHKLSR